MSKYIPLNKSKHRLAGLAPADYAFAQGHAYVPLAAQELPQVLPTMPVAFVRSHEKNAYLLVAVQSLRPNTNVYVHVNGRWIGGYRPAWYRTHPLRLFQRPSDQRCVVYIDESSSAFKSEADETAQRLFTDDGELTERTRGAMKFLEDLQRASETTSTLVEQIQAADLIVPWHPSLPGASRSADGLLQGLYQIDEQRLKSLAGKSLKGLAESGALTIAYAQLLSQHRLPGLTRLHDLRAQAEGQSSDVKSLDLDALFGSDDELSFNFE